MWLTDAFCMLCSDILVYPRLLPLLCRAVWAVQEEQSYTKHAVDVWDDARDKGGMLGSRIGATERSKSFFNRDFQKVPSLSELREDHARLELRYAKMAHGPCATSPQSGGSNSSSSPGLWNGNETTDPSEQMQKLKQREQKEDEKEEEEVEDGEEEDEHDVDERVEDMTGETQGDSGLPGGEAEEKDTRNPYERVIDLFGSTLRSFDPGREFIRDSFPVFGFADLYTRDQGVFPLCPDPLGGVEGVENVRDGW